MTETTVYVRMPRSRVHSIIRSIPAAARQGGPADDILKRAGDAFLSRVHRAFLIKSRGGTDECGDRWKPLARSTVLKRLRKKNPTRESDRPSSALSPMQREKWWGYYRGALAKYKDKGIAAKVAWKQLGGGGHYDKYGSTSLGILLDTEELLRSLQPGGSKSQVFRISPGEVKVGTNRKGALANHKGGGNLLQRRLWPPPQKWTSAWWQEMLRSASIGVAQLIVEKLK